MVPLSGPFILIMIRFYNNFHAFRGLPQMKSKPFFANRKQVHTELIRCFWKVRNLKSILKSLSIKPDSVLALWLRISWRTAQVWCVPLKFKQKNVPAEDRTQDLFFTREMLYLWATETVFADILNAIRSGIQAFLGRPLQDSTIQFGNFVGFVSRLFDAMLAQHTEDFDFNASLVQSMLDLSKFFFEFVLFRGQLWTRFGQFLEAFFQFGLVLSMMVSQCICFDSRVAN